MTEGAFDIAICGATPFAGLLAGILAAEHGKRVCLIGEPWSPYRLARTFDVSVMPSTRPETWTMLKRGGAETLKLLGSIGKGLTERVDPLFVADLPATADYLGHMRWTALSSGFAAERAIDRAVTVDGVICRVRDAAMLIDGKAEPAIEAWLDKLGVARFPAANTAITARKEGGYLLRADEREAEAEVVVLADDDAILTRLNTSERRLMSVTSRTNLTTEAVAKPVPASFMNWLDRGVIVHQRHGRTPIAATAVGDADTALARIGASTPGTVSLRRSAQAQFRAVETTDGAPLVGRIGRARFLVIAGLGTSAVFLAPIIARGLVDAGSEDEAQYLAARDAGRASARALVAENITVHEPEAAA